MPAFETMDLIHRALRWAKVGGDNYAEAVVSTVPDDIRCRWNDKQSDSLDAQGNMLRTDVDLVVKTDLNLGDILWQAPNPKLPALDQWLGTGSGADFDPILFQVVVFNSGQDLKGRFTRREVKLMRWRGSLPQQV